MAYLKIEIESDNEAFDTTEKALEELNRIISTYIKLHLDGSQVSWATTMYDVNGNKVGNFEFSLFGDDE